MTKEIWCDLFDQLIADYEETNWSVGCNEEELYKYAVQYAEEMIQDTYADHIGSMIDYARQRYKDDPEFKRQVDFHKR